MRAAYVVRSIALDALHGGNVELEGKTGSRTRRALHLECSTHRRDELLADRQPEPSAREDELAGLTAASDGVEERLDNIGGDATPRIANGKLDASTGHFSRRNLD